RTRIPHDHTLRARRTIFVVRRRQREDAEAGGEKIPGKHESVARRTAGGLSRSRTRRKSLHRKQESGRYREFVRDVSRQYFPGFADLAVRDKQGTGRRVGSRDRM